MTSAVTIIGAGSAGLATAAALRKRGIEPVILERGDGVATSWRQRHEELRLNTIRWMSDLPGLRLPRSLGRWVSRDDYVAYLERYALHHRFDIRFNIQVNSIDATDAGWCLETANGLMQTEHVVLATGHDQEPHLPDWPGSDSFSGRIVHVAQLSRAADLVGESVLLVGAGNSGVEIAGHLVNAGVSQLWVSVRTPPNIMPRELVGVPLHPITQLLQILPEPMRDGVARAVGRLAFGDLTRYGLSTPQQGPYARLRTSGVTVAVDQGFVDHLRSGHLKIVAEVDRFEGHKVVLGNGQVLRPDIVLAATGFCNGLNPLVGHLGILDTRHRPPSHSSALGLWFIGFRVAIEGNLRQHPREAARIAGAIAKARTDSARGRTRRRLWTGNATRERASTLRAGHHYERMLLAALEVMAWRPLGDAAEVGGAIPYAAICRLGAHVRLLTSPAKRDAHLEARMRALQVNIRRVYLRSNCRFPAKREEPRCLGYCIPCHGRE